MKSKMKKIQPKKNLMETLLLKIMLSWAIMIIGFVALFAGCNNPRTKNPVTDDNMNDTIQEVLPDNTRTDGIKQKRMADTAVIEKTN
jgi:hypothetical protein